MNKDWQKKLESFGLTQTGDAFAYPAQVTAENILCTLASDVVLEVSGEDAESFLQGQFSNDIAALAVPGSQLTTWSSPKGRVIAVLRVVRTDSGYLIKLPQALVEPVLKRLRMYVLMAKVVIEPRDDLIVAGVSGESSVATLGNAGCEVPLHTDETVALEDAWLTRVRGDNRFEIIATAEKLAPLWTALMESCQMADEHAWRLQNIDAGVPSVGADTSEAFVLQMLNLQHIDGVSFKKGCFPGQEVVARMQYLGKLKRQMYRMSCEGDIAPVPGAEIFKAGGGSAAGKVVDAVSTDANNSRLLAVVAIDAVQETLFLDKEGKQALQVLELPYDLTPANSQC